jgi:hypothetical protein
LDLGEVLGSRREGERKIERERERGRERERERERGKTNFHPSPPNSYHQRWPSK